MVLRGHELQALRRALRFGRNQLRHGRIGTGQWRVEMRGSRHHACLLRQLAGQGLQQAVIGERLNRPAVTLVGELGHVLGGRVAHRVQDQRKDLVWIR